MLSFVLIRENKMTTETTTQPDPSIILCRVIDVNNAIQNTFQKFLSAEGKTLEDLANILKDEMSTIELFAPQVDNSTTPGT